MRLFPTIFALGAFAALAACNNQADEASGGGAQIDGEALPNPDAPVSILRPDVEQPELPAIILEPLNVTIGFPEGGSALGAAAASALEEVLSSEQVTGGGPITLRAHSDAGGNDAANLRASAARGEAVRDWLVDNGIAEGRITVIAFGEQNPAQPNALPDGAPNEAGRAANRRVDIEVSVAEVTAPEIEAAPTADPAS